MTVSNDTNKTGPFVGDDSTTEFPFTKKTFAVGDLTVVFSDDDGSEVVLTYASDYSVSLNADQDASPGGTVTYPVSGDPLSTDEYLVILREVDETQSSDITNLGSFYPDIVENMADRATMMAQQNAERGQRALRLSRAASAGQIASMEMPASTRSKYPFIDSSGLMTFVSTAIDTSTPLTAALIGETLYPFVSGGPEDTAGLTEDDIVDFTKQVGDPERYVANATPGTTNMQLGIQRALNVADAAGGGVVQLQPEAYRVDTGLTIYGGTILRGAGRGQRFSTFGSETGTIIIAGAAMATLATTTANSASAGGAVVEDLLLDGANNAATVFSMEGIRDTARNLTVTRGTTYGLVNDVTGVAEQILDNVFITMDSQGTAAWYVESGSDSNYHNVVVHGAATAILIESGGHQFSHIHPYPDPIDPDNTDWLIDINATGDNFFVNCHLDQVHKADRAQLRIRTDTEVGDSALDNVFVACSFDNPSMDANDVVAVLMDASLGSNNWITASFIACTISGNGTNKYTYGFEKVTSGAGRIIYSVINGQANNVTALWSHAPDQTFGFRHLSGGITEVGNSGMATRGLLGIRSGGELTIATGAITITDSHHRVDTEADAATDDLDTINGGTDGEILVLQAQDSARTVVLKDGTGNLALNDDFSLLNDQASITLQYHLAQTEWVEISRTPGVANVAYTPTNDATDRSWDADAAAGAITSPPTQAEVENIRDAVLELSDVMATLVSDLQARGVIG